MSEDARNSPDAESSAAPAETLERIAVAIVLQRQRVLVGRRPLGVAMAGYAEFPGGKIQADETPDQAAARECKEETGMLVEAHESLNIMRHAIENGSREIHFVRCTLRGESIARPPFEWVPLARLTAYRFPPANSEILAILRRMSEE